MKMKKGLLMMALLAVAGVAFAQGDIAVEAATQKTDLWSLLKQGGWAMFPLGAFSFFMVALVIQNFISLRPKTLLHTEQMPELLESSTSFTDVGDEWRRYALYAAKMIKGRMAMDYDKLADQLLLLADQEEAAYRRLGAIVFK